MIKRLLNLIPNFGKKALLDIESENRFFGGSGSSYSSTVRRPKDYLDAYVAISYIASCVNTIASDIALFKFKICDDEGIERPADEIVQLLKQPNQTLTYSNFIQTIVTHFLLDGNAFIVMDQQNALSLRSGRPSELQVLNPSLVDIYDPNGGIIRGTSHQNSFYVKQYIIDVMGHQIKVDDEDLVHIKMASPYNTLRGLGIIAQNATIIDADRFTSIFNNAFFNQGARTNALVSLKDDMYKIPSTFKEFVSQFRREYEGADNWGKLMFTSGDVDVKSINLSHNDMQFIEQKKMSRQDINAMFKIPPVISQIFEDAKYDSAETQERLYRKNVLSRYSKPVEQGLNKIVKRFDTRLNFRFVVPNMIDQQELKNWFDRGIISGNEYREMAGIETGEADHLDEYYMSLNYLPVGSVVLPEVSESQEESKSLDDYDAKASALQWTIHKQAKATKSKAEKLIEKEVIAFYKGVERRALAGLEKLSDIPNTKGADIEDVFNLNNEMDEAKKASRRFFTSVVALGIKDMNNVFNTSVDSTFSNLKVRLVVEKLETQYATRTLNTRKEELRKLLNTALDEGVSISEIKVRIQDHFDDLNNPDNGWKATRIARAESRNAYDEASKLSYEELGVKQVKVVGCQDPGPPWDCDDNGNRAVHSIEKMTSLNFKPNHTGTVVPIVPRSYFLGSDGVKHG